MPDYPIGSLDYILSEVPNGRDLSILWTRALALAGDEQSKKFVQAYEERDRDDQRLDDFLPKGMDGADYLANFVRCAQRYSTLHIETLKIAHLPEVYRKSLEVAQTDKGFDDRTAILKADSLHHAPKASQININQNQLNASGLPNMADFTRELERLDEPRQITQGSAEFVPTAEIIEEGVKVER